MATQHSDSGIRNARTRYTESKSKHIRLDVSRGARIDLYGDCSRCGQFISPLWFYAKSSHGPVYLCVRCKEKALEKRRIAAGGQVKPDVLRWALPGGFESGKRRR